MIPNTRNLSRYREIVTVLARHGFGWLLADSKLRDLLPLAQRLGRSDRVEPENQAAHLRLAFEELGTTFIKLGQVLSTRPDLLPPDYIAELSRLQEAVGDRPGAAGGHPDQRSAGPGSRRPRPESDRRQQRTPDVGRNVRRPTSSARLRGWPAGTACACPAI